MLRAAILPAGVAGAVCAVVATVTGGTAGLLAALVGVLLVVLFFGSSLLVLERTARVSPPIVMLVALGTYTLKVLLLALAFLVLSRTTDLPGPALGLTTIVVTTVWLAAELRAFVRTRQPLYAAPAADEGDEPVDDGSASDDRPGGDR